jgi:acetylornithine deacetylase
VASALLRLAELRRGDPRLRHALLAPPSLHITGFHGGSYIATIPEAAELLVNATYLPCEADASGFGENVRRQLTAAVEGVCDSDGWLAEHRPAWTWLLDYPPYEVAGQTPILTSLLAAAHAAGHTSARPVGLDSGYDGALLSALYGIPSLALDPGDVQVAHSTDEFVIIDELLTAARVLAWLVIGWCGLDVPG